MSFLQSVSNELKIYGDVKKRVIESSCSDYSAMPEEAQSRILFFVGFN
jgi:hypothetical protein